MIVLTAFLFVPAMVTLIAASASIRQASARRPVRRLPR